MSQRNKKKRIPAAAFQRDAGGGASEKKRAMVDKIRRML